MLSRRGFAIGLLAGTIVRVAALPLPGTGDVAVWKIWAHAAATRGVTQMYGVGGTPPERRLHPYDGREATVDYPPLGLHELAIAGLAYRLATGGFVNGPAFTAAVKLPSFFAEIGLTWLLMAAVRRAAPGRPDLSRLAGLAYWLNPAAILTVSMLGYLDPLFALPLVGALVAAWARRSWLAGALLAAAVLTKPQALLLGPVIALAVWGKAQPGLRGREIAKASVAGAAVVVTFVLPFVLAGAMPNLLQAMASLGRHNTLSATAANAWWVVTWIVRAVYAAADLGWVEAFTMPVKRPLMITTLIDLGYPNPRPLGTMLALAAMTWGIWRARAARALATFSAIGAWVVWSYFMLAIAVHENHGFMVVPLLALAAALNPRWRGLALVLSVSTALNLNLFYGVSERIGFAIPRAGAGIDTAVWLAVANIGVFVWFAKVLSRELAAGDAAT